MSYTPDSYKELTQILSVSYNNPRSSYSGLLFILPGDGEWVILQYKNQMIVNLIVI
jgi:hypothetical protein